MSDEQLERWGKYFVVLKLREIYGITFEQFTEIMKNGEWSALWKNNAMK